MSLRNFFRLLFSSQPPPAGRPSARKTGNMTRREAFGIGALAGNVSADGQVDEVPMTYFPERDDS